MNVHADICDFSQIEKYFAKVDFVFHLAAQSRVQPSIAAPLDTIATNVMGTANVLEASRLHGVQRVIYSTTSSYYGVKNSTPNVETQLEDVIEANYLVMTSSRIGTGETYNVGSGKSLSILEIAALISDNVVFLPPRPAEAQASMADTSKIQSHYGWSPKKNLASYIQEQLEANLR